MLNTEQESGWLLTETLCKGKSSQVFCPVTAASTGSHTSYVGLEKSNVLGIDGLDVGWQLHCIHPSAAGDRTWHHGMPKRLLGDFLLCVPAPWGSVFGNFSLLVGKLERGRRNGNPKSPRRHQNSVWPYSLSRLKLFCSV